MCASKFTANRSLSRVQQQRKTEVAHPAAVDCTGPAGTHLKHVGRDHSVAITIVILRQLDTTMAEFAAVVPGLASQCVSFPAPRLHG